MTLRLSEHKHNIVFLLNWYLSFGGCWEEEVLEFIKDKPVFVIEHRPDGTRFIYKKGC
jgi:hypothetical protein